MIILELIVAAYFIIGFLYALYILLFAYDPWYMFPVNVVGGPIMLLVIIYYTVKGKRMPAYK